jgi:hypothetical protein
MLRRPKASARLLAAWRLAAALSDIQQQTSRVFQQVLDGHQEGHSFFAVDQR